MESAKKFATVIVDQGFDRPLDYSIPEELAEKVRVGTKVTVTLRGIPEEGIVWKLKSEASVPKTVPIIDVADEGVLLDESLCKLAEWLSKYYCTPLRKVINTMVPSPVRKSAGHKEQYFVSRTMSKAKLQTICRDLREAHPSQAKVLDVLLEVKKGILLSELLDKAGVTQSPVMTLAKQNLLSLDIVRVDRSPLIGEEYFKTAPKTLTDAQSAAFEKIMSSIREKRFETHLIHGITGSGKTEIYLQVIAQVLQMGLGAIMLVPEISLTPQTIERFRSRFEGQIAILHHRLSEGERYDEWSRMAEGIATIAIGARSAVFSPIQKLGVIIVDEEHDNAFKQSEDSFTYHARDVAVMRGKISNATVILASATPSLESMYNASLGKYTLSELSEHTESAKLPQITLVDMTKDREAANKFSIFSPTLVDKLIQKVSLGEQVILFLNRRGYHTTYMCGSCGNIFTCPNCSVSLTFHKGENTLACHLCDTKITPPPRSCSKCGKSETLKFRGIGTEQVERALHALIPTVRSIRVDSDTTRHKGSLEKMMHTFRTQKADVLIGTQMVAKGLHFPAVTLVAILNADSGLHMPDFRASERVFQLITQVAGRAGRGSLPGEVIVQTHMADNPTIKLAAEGKQEEFYKTEMETRKFFEYPPYNHLVKCTFIGAHEKDIESAGNRFRSILIQHLSQHFLIHPLVVCGHAKVKEQFRYQFLIRGKSALPIVAAIEKSKLQFTGAKNVKMMIDVDPLSTYY